MMANLKYLKGVRTRYKNTLETEIQFSVDLIQGNTYTANIEEQIIKANKCLEKLKSYKEKLEIQSEKLISAMDEKDSERIENILEEDCKLCEYALDCYLDLKQFKENLITEKQEPPKEILMGDSTTYQLVQLQKDMQQLFSNQLKQQQEIVDKQDSNTKISMKLPKLEMISFNGDKTKWIEF